MKAIIELYTTVCLCFGHVLFIYFYYRIWCLHEKAIIQEELVDSLFTKVRECETTVLHLSTKFATFRKNSMAAAIQDATDNPNKYLQGSYFIEPVEGKLK